jgi:signal transduction histidine kinase/ActR/RegA family two-component response regulator
MSPIRGWSIGARLAWGFGAVIAVLALFAALTLSLQQRSGEAQLAYAQKFGPRVDAASDLERALAHVAIGWRNWFISGTQDHANTASVLIEEARLALRAVARLPRDPDGEELFARVEPAVQRYLGEVAGAMRTGRLSNPAAVEDALSEARTEAMSAITAFSRLQRVKAQRSIAAMQASREQLSSALLLTFLLVAIVLAVLGIVITASIRGPARALTRIANDMQAGDWHPALELGPAAAKARGAGTSSRDELAQIGLAFGAAAEALERREQRLRADARIAGAASASLEKTTIAEEALAAMAEAIGATVGAIYWREADGSTLRPIATRAVPAEAEPVRLGEGLLGLAAQEGRVKVVTGIPHGSPFRLRIGIDELTPHSVVAVPAILRRELHGVAVLATMREVDAAAVEFLEAAGLQLAIGLANARAHEYVRRLLEQVREGQERLQSQNEELQAQSEELQAQNEEIQVQSEELQRHAARLTEGDERKNEFIGLLAHELRNPLAAIANGVYILNRAPVPAEGHGRVLALIQRQIGYLTRIIDDLLDVSRIAHGKLRLSREVLDLCELVHHSVNDQGQVATQARVTLEAHVPPEPIHVKGDRTRLAQVLGNLIGNAVKFTDQGGRVTVSVRTSSDGAATIAIRDTGMGIEPTVLDKLFQPFSQGRPPQSRSNGGLGLGLALSKALIELHEGTIEARSEGLGRGSVFIVTLPASDEVPVPRTPATGVHRGARRILLIEDNDDAAEALQGALRLQGHEVDVACNGLEGVEKAYSLRPDLVLCDLAIPGIDGYEVARRLRADPRLSATPLVALSGYATTEDQRRSNAAGFDDHLAKPVAMERLLDVIARCAKHPQASSGVTA